MTRFAIACAVTIFLGVASARADYTMTPRSSGLSSKTVAPGDSFFLDIVLTSSGSDTNTSAVFDVDFSQAGLSYNSYTWGGTYAASSFDNSSPNNSMLPTLITASTYGNSSSPIDVHFENFTTTAFSTGTLVTLNLTVPPSFTNPSTVMISAVPDTISGDSGNITTVAGTPFQLNVVPEPGSLSVLALGTMLLVRRCRRSNSRP